jgi:Ser/Thr protein kinase RdoA (MazF antagonist)
MTPLDPQLLAQWGLEGADAQPVTTGLINTTYLLTQHGRPVAILQRLNSAIFKASVHLDMHGISEVLTASGVGVPALRRTLTGELWLERDDGVWRAMHHVGDRTVERLTDPADARSAGHLIARFHEALTDLDWTFHHVRAGAHDTDAHMATLATALDELPLHRHHAAIGKLADTLFARWGRLGPDVPTSLPTRIVHGDLKISNLRFDGPDATSLIDLDTLAHGTLDVELGDALRSWCASASEDATELSFRADIFESAMQGYASGAGRWGPTQDEWASIVPGIERICTELAARFAADALRESYFGWDPTSFTTRGDHNLTRALGQASLAAAVEQARPHAERRLSAALRGAGVRPNDV